MIKFPAKKYSTTIFMRLLFIYGLVIAPIVLLGLYLYQWSYDNAREDISRATVSQLQYYLDDLNREIEWMELQQFALLEDNELKKLALTWDVMTNVERHRSLMQVTERLTTLKTNSPYIQNINIHIPEINKSITALHGVVPIYDQYEAFLSAYKSKTMERLYYWNEGLHLMGLKYGGTGYDPIYVIQIELNSGELAKSLDQLSIYPDSGAFLLTSNQYRIINKEVSAPIVQSYMMRTEKQINEQNLVHENTTYHINNAYSDKLKLTVVSYIPEDTVKRPLLFFSQWVWVFIVVSLISIIVIYYSTYRLIHKPMLLLVQSFRSMEEGNLNNPIRHENKDEFGFIYTRFNQMQYKLKSLIDQDYKQKMMMQRSELKQLQSQINPHFLYNSFFILNSLAKINDVERIEQFTVMLGEYFRFITRNSNDLVLLSEEVKHSRVYTEIQGLRFSRRIVVNFEPLPEQFEQLKVPRLIIQPIIENAYEHCLEKMDENGILSVRFELGEQDEPCLNIIIEDNGTKLTDEQLLSIKDRLNQTDLSSEITGMINIHRRLILTFGDKSGLFLERGEMKGLKATIRIYYKLEQRDEH